MKRNSFGRTVLATVSATAIAGLTLSACGSDNNAGAPATTATSGATGAAAAGAECGRQGSAASVALPDGWLADPDDCTVPDGADAMHSGG